MFQAGGTACAKALRQESLGLFEELKLLRGFGLVCDQEEEMELQRQVGPRMPA